VSFITNEKKWAGSKMIKREKARQVRRAEKVEIQNKTKKKRGCTVGYFYRGRQAGRMQEKKPYRRTTLIIFLTLNFRFGRDV
jgi:hypothetical protein